MMTPEGPAVTRTWIARAFTAVEDVVYVGLGLLLGGSAIVLLIGGIFTFVHTLGSGAFAKDVVTLLDRILLILLVVELLYTVQVSFREHALVPEPFLLVGLIAAIRRVLVLTAEYGHVQEHTDTVFRNFFIELSVLAGFILVVTFSLVLLKRSEPKAQRA